MRNIFKLFTTHYSKLTKLFAFTLAEIVIVMGIVGIIGVLAVSNAKKDTDVAEKVAQLRKTYQTLESAFATAVMENGPINTWGTNGADPTRVEVWNVISPYLKLMKNCGTASGCWKDTLPLNLDGTSEQVLNIDTVETYCRGILANNVPVAISYGSNTNSGFRAGHLYVYVVIDVNGKKGLNMFGNDIFAVGVDEDGSVHPILSPNYPNDISDKDDKGIYKTAWVLKFGNMDYLKPCAGSLSWTGNHTCK